MQLVDYFAPLNLENTLTLLLALIIFDAAGTTIATYFDFPRFLRLTNWIVGLALFVFIWFLLHLFIPFLPQYVWTSLVVMGALFLPVYFIKMRYVSLFTEVLLFPFPLAFFALVIKPMFFLVSLPPYLWDEMAYHFAPPALLFTEKAWLFTQSYGCKCWGLYEMIPRFLETMFTTFLSLTQTYSTGRALHLLLFFSCIYAVAIFIKEKYSYFPAIVYSFLALFLTSSMLTSATLGYNDSAAAGLTNVFFVCVIGFISSNKKGYLFAAATFLGLAISIKYTPLGFVLATTIVALVLYLLLNLKSIIFFFRKISLHSIKQFSFVLWLPVLMGVFGGYWYVKNWVVTGNPIFPFYFSCKNGIPCGKQNEFFSGWSISFKEENYEQLKSAIFHKSPELYDAFFYAIVAAVVLGVATRKKNVVLIAVMIAAGVYMEIQLSKNIVGFADRYFYHWYLLIPLGLSLPFFIDWKAGRVVFATTLIIFNFLGNMVYDSAYKISAFNKNKMREELFVSPEYRNYARSRFTLNEWIASNFPNMKDVIFWCGEKREMTALLVSDPQVIWSSYEGLMRVFLVNCDQVILPMVEKENLNQYVQDLKKQYSNAYIVSLDKCNPKKPNIDATDSEKTIKLHYELNQRLICEREESFKNMYKL